MTKPRPDLFGVVPPVITPVDENDRVDEPAFRAVLRRMIDVGVHGIFVAGTNGEAPLLTQSEFGRMAEIAIDEVGDRLPLLGGVMECSTAKVVERIRILRGLGYERFAVTPTFYMTLREPTEFLRLYETCADAKGDMEMIAYNIASMTHSCPPVEVLVEATRRGLLRTCKDTAADLAYHLKLLAAAKEVGLRVLTGNENHIKEGLKAGSVGIIPSHANYDPKVYIAAYEASVAGDWAKVDECMGRISYLHANIARAGSFWCAGVKYSVACLGIGNGKPISPLEPLNAEQQAKMRAWVAEDTARRG